MVSIIHPYTAQTIVYPHNSSAVLSDTDQDGLLDGEEVLQYRTSPGLSDTDNDTLTDWDEVHVHGTDPANNDTDGDGKKEVVVGSFDNNIYTFEHVYKNTYRRAWRSPDLKHNETLTFTSLALNWSMRAHARMLRAGI